LTTATKAQKRSSADNINDAMHAATVMGARGTKVDAIEKFLGIKNHKVFPKRRLSKGFEISDKDLATLGHHGVIRDHAGLPIFDPNPELHPILARGLYDDHGIFHEMRMTDPVLAGVLSMVIRKISRAQVRLREIDDPTPQEQLGLDLSARYMGLDGTPGWLHGGRHNLLKHACQAMPYGYSCSEVTWTSEKFNGQTVWSPSKVAWRAPWTLERILWQGDNIVGVQQLVQNDAALNTGPSNSLSSPNLIGGWQRIIIPANRLLWFGYGDLDGNPGGVSALRPSFRYWQLKQNTLRRIESAESLLFGGVSILEMQETDEFVPHPAVSQKDTGFWQDALRYWKDGSLDYIIKPRGWNLNQKWPDYELEDRTQYLTWIDYQLLITLSAAVFGLPSSHAGSKALAGGLGQVFYDALSDIAQAFLDVINGIHGQPMTGLLRRLIDQNVETHEGFRYSQLEVVGLEHQDLKAFADIYTKLVQFFGLTPMPEDELHLRETLSLPKPPLDKIKEAQKDWQGKQRRISEQGQQGAQTGTALPSEE